MQAGKHNRTLLGVAAGIALLAVAGCETFDQEPEPVAETKVFVPPPEPVAVPVEEVLGTPAPVPKRKPQVAAEDLPAEPVQQQQATAPAAETGQGDMEPDGLVGLDFVKTEDLLGPPSLLTEEPPAKIWSYNGRNCVLQLFFYPKVGGAFEVLTYKAIGGEGDRQEVGDELARNCLMELIVEREALDAES